MRVFNKQIATNVSIASGFTSAYVPLKSTYMYSMVAIITGSPTGTLKLQASNDPETNDTQINSTGLPPAVGPSNWVDIANSTFTITSAGETMWNVRDPAYNYVRVVYTGSGAATMTLIVNSKGV
jgi:hypothetical protein